MSSVEPNLDVRVQRLEAQNRRLLGLVLALALLVLVGAVLIQFHPGAYDKPLAFFLDESGKPEASIQVGPSGQVRVVSMRPDGRLPSLNVDGTPNRNYVMLYDSGGKPRMIFAPRPGDEVTAVKSSMLQTPNAAKPASAPAGEGHSCNLSLPTAPGDGVPHIATQIAKKEEGEAASVREESDRDGSRVKTVLFDGFLLDGIYTSMTGPRKQQRLILGDAADKQVWVTSFRTDVLDSKSNVTSQQYMCHAALDIVGPAGPDGEPTDRRQAFTVSQGQTEIAFPRGFAMPIPNIDKQESLLVQVLNNNEPQIHRELKFKATLHYFGDQDAQKRKLIPLKLTGGSVSAVIDPASAHPQEMVVRPAHKEEIFRTPDGRLATAHWLVPPGKQVITTELGLDLARDTTVHFMWMHVHPYAESLELHDKTIDQLVWKGHVKNDPDSKRASILSTETYSSKDGLVLHRDHKYELIATYENPTQRPVDAMASLWMYVRAD